MWWLAADATKILVSFVLYLSSLYHVAGVIQGESGVCPTEAKVAIAHLYSRNTEMYGWQKPNREAMRIAFSWQHLPDYSRGAVHAFSKEDLKQERVQEIINGRGPLAIYRCAMGLEIYFY